MPEALYRTKLTDDPQFGPFFAECAAEFQALAGRGADATYNQGAKELEIYIEWKDFVARYPKLAELARFRGSSKRGAADLEKDAALPALVTRRAQMLDGYRDALRNIPLPPTGAQDPANQTGIQPNMDARTGRQTVMQNSGGFCQGRDHGVPEPLEMLTQGLDDGSLLNGGGLLFIEELPASLQDMLDAWLAAPAGTDMPPALKKAVTDQDTRMAPKTPFKDLLDKAKEKAVKVYGIDGGDATPGVDNTHGGQPERRDVKMNALAKDVIDKAKAKHGNLPMIASVGEAHVNHHEGGVPGIAQIMGVPGVVTDPGGKLVPVPDDPTLRGMPSKAVQAFIDAYIDALEADIPATAKDALGGDKDAFKADIYKNAKTLADRLVAEGSITDVASAKKAVGLDVAKDQREEYVTLVKSWPGRAGKADDVARNAVRAGSPAFLDKMVADHPAVLNKADGDQRTLMHWAAMMGQPEMIGSLAANGERLDPVDKDGNQPLQAAVKRRRDKPDPRVAFQGATVKALVDEGADVNAAGEGGRTAMHFAALNNNTAALGELGAANARTDIPDARGWTAYDTAVGSTKVEAEQWFYGKGQTNAPGLAPNSPALDTVEALMKSVKCENPGKHQQKVQDALKELYGNPDLRPALDLLAKNSLLPRDADGGGGLKIFIADRDNVGLLYNSVSGKGPAGAYDENAHVVHVAGEGTRDFAGELCHELTHAATRVAFDTKDDVPFKDNQQKGEFLQAIENDVKAMSLIMKGNAQEQNIKTVVSDRMATTVRDYPNEADLKLMQEFTVSVPQLIAEYGSDEVEKLAPGLTKFYRSNFAKACTTAANDPKYAFVDKKLDNTALAQSAQPRAVAKPTWLPTGKDTVGTAVDMVRQSYKVMNGQPQPLPATATIPFQTDNYALDPAAERAFEAKMQQVDKAMRKAIKDEGWPPEISADALRAMAVELGNEIKSGKPVKELVAAVQARVMMAVRQSKIDYVDHCDKENQPVSDQALAEATVISAENRAWAAGGAVDGADLIAIEVDKGKHKSMITDLKKTLSGNTGTRAKAKGGMSVVTTLSASLAGDKTKGFFLKTDKRGRQATSHVSISKKDAKAKWLAELRAA